jgi:hypothetical protein
MENRDDITGSRSMEGPEGYTFRGPEGVLIWCDQWPGERKEEAQKLFPWWYKVKGPYRESLSDFAPTWTKTRPPNFLFKEMNTGRLIGSIPYGIS